MRYWVKLWTEMLDDPKMGRITDRQHRLCTNLFCLAGIIDDDGRLLSTEDIAYKVRRDVEGVAADLDALAAVNIVEQVDGAWQLIHFGKRNERPPSAKPEAVKDRVERYREKQRDDGDGVTTCNDVTPSLQKDVTTSAENVTTMLRDVTSLEQEQEQEQIRSEADQIRGRQEADQNPTKSQILPAASPDALALLLALPMEEPNASKVATAGLDWVQGWLDEFERRKRNGRPINSPPAMLYSMFTAGESPPARAAPPGTDLAAYRLAAAKYPEVMTG